MAAASARQAPTAFVGIVVGFLALGRCVEFFFGWDSATIGLGLAIAQWTSLVLLVVSAVGALIALTRGRNVTQRS